ncbi:atrial natriuretic peptide receptor 1-like [Limulus polyphemus]|uniref:Atrial natriuretic peptide receptor 1-like n=1 Tax=Limulus polyphemus TaxID=6850 RepID=A0ABM1BAY9_LIMPO|nr:atrial natriuretic peptide receptor 1-like [Limulus polyphemus]
MKIVLLMLMYYVVINSELGFPSKIVGNISGRFQARMVSILLSRAGRPFDQELVHPAVAIAQKTIRKFYPNIDLQVVFLNGTNDCTANYAGAMAAEQYYRHYVSGFLGPGCSLALDPVARMAARWSIPICTAAGSNSMFGNKKDFSTLTRLSHTMGGIANTVLSVLRFFGWHHVAILYDGAQGFSSLVASSLERALRRDLKFFFYLHHQEFNSLQKNVPFREMLETAAKSARVFFISANGQKVREILLVAHDLGMGDGEFVFLTVELFKNERSFGNFSWYQLGDTRNQDARRIYDSLFSISIRAPEGPEYQSFVQEVINTSWTVFGTKFTHDAVNFIVAGFHDCVVMYAWALNQTLADGGDPLDGSSIIRKLWNNTFRGGITGDIIINANGDRETDYTLNELDEKSGEMKPVAIYFGFTEKFQLLDGAKIHWPGGRTSPPPDVPSCGFLGDEPMCHSKGYTHKNSIIFRINVNKLIALILKILNKTQSTMATTTKEAENNVALYKITDHAICLNYSQEVQTSLNSSNKKEHYQNKKWSKTTKRRNQNLRALYKMRKSRESEQYMSTVTTFDSIEASAEDNGDESYKASDEAESDPLTKKKRRVSKNLKLWMIQSPASSSMYAVIYERSEQNFMKQLTK